MSSACWRDWKPSGAAPPGVRQAKQVVVIGDGAAWIDTLHQRHFGRHVPTVDWYHAAEHLHEVAKAAHPEHAGEQKQLAGRLTDALWRGHVQTVVLAIEELVHRAGPVRVDVPGDHPRRILRRNLGYFQRHAPNMNYPSIPPTRLAHPRGSAAA